MSKTDSYTRDAGFDDEELEVTTTEGDFSRSRAVVIGINAYGNGIPSLSTAVNDARRLAEILQAQHNYEVELLLDEQARLAGLQRLLDAADSASFVNRVGAEDRVLLYFAGHGVAMPSDEGPVGYLVPQDGRLTQAETTFWPMRALYAALDSLACRHLLIILDCCFAGAFRWSVPATRFVPPPRQLYAERYRRYIRHAARQAITSAGDDQKALDVATTFFSQRQVAAADEKHSPFALALFRALGDSADKVITATELYMHLRDAVEAEADSRRHRQTPGLWPLQNHDKGEYVFTTGKPRLTPAPALKAENNPYRGLETYQEADEALFFGRAALVQELAARVSDQSLTVLLGASGSGKSSLVQAGLVPRLRQFEGRRPDIQGQTGGEANGDSTPSQPPPARERSQSFPASEGERGGETITQTTLSTPEEREGPHPTITTFRPTAQPLAPLQTALDELGRDDGAPKILIIDQFEELITLCQDDEERRQFLTQLTETLSDQAGFDRLVIAVRTDFEAHLFQHFEVALTEQWMANRVMIPPLSQSELREVIEGPAAATALYFEPPDLVDHLIAEVLQTPGGLPLLSFTLSELYLMYLQRGDQSRALLGSDYQTLGGIDGALRRRATAEYEALGRDLDAAHQATMRRVMLRMVSLEGGKLARRPVPRPELIYPNPAENERVTTVIRRLTKARLLVADDSGGVAYLEPADDALIVAWKMLTGWLEAERAMIPLQRRLTQAALDWQQAESETAKAGYLWSHDPRLPDLERLISGDDEHWLNRLETDFVRASIARREVEKLEAARQKARARANRLATFANNEETSSLQLMLARDAVLTTWHVDPAGPFATIEAETALRQAIDKALFEPPPDFDPRSLSSPQHQDTIWSVAFSPDGQTLVTASEDQTVRLWEVSSGRQIGMLLGHIAGVSQAVFSPDGRWLASAGWDRTVRLWDALTGEKIRRFEGHTDGLWSVAFSPDGKMLATGGRDRVVRLWEVASGREIGQFVGHTEGVLVVAFSADGQTLLTASGDPFDVDMFGAAVTATRDNSVRLWEVATRQETARLAAHQGPIWSAALSRDGRRLVTASLAWDDPVARLWDVTAQRQLLTFESGQKYSRLWLAAFSPDDRHIVTAGGQGPRLWEAAGGAEIRTFSGAEYGGMMWTLAFSPDGRLLVAASGNELRWREVATGVAVQFAEAGPAQFQSVTPAAGDEAVVPPKGDQTFEGKSAVFSPDGRLLALEREAQTVLVGVSTGAEMGRVEGGGAIFSPDGRWLVTKGDDDTARLWDVATFEERPALAEQSRAVVRSIRALSEDGRLLVTDSYQDGSLYLWEVATGQKIKQISGHLTLVTAVAFSPDGQMLVSAAEERTAYVWDVATGEQIGVLEGHEAQISGVTFSPDGRRIATASSDNSARLWDVATRTMLRSFNGHTNWVRSVVFSEQGDTLLTASADGTARLWEVATGEEIRRLTGNDNLGSATFSPDGRFILTADFSGTVRLWAPVTELLAQAETLIRRDPPIYTTDERRRFGLEYYFRPSVGGAAG